MLRRWKTACLAYCDPGGGSMDGSEVVNNIVELGRRIARWFNIVEYYCRAMFLAAGKLDALLH